MHTFRLAPTVHARPEALRTTTCAGPFLVDAIDEVAARMLVGLNFSIAVARARRSNAIPSLIWGDAAQSVCHEVFPPASDAWHQRLFIAGVDFARFYIDEPELVRPVGGLVARLRWWPCEPTDVCPA
ncbi:MAG: hypothetical protein AAFO79_03380 [Pseudomonadota bacterium]